MNKKPKLLLATQINELANLFELADLQNACDLCKMVQSKDAVISAISDLYKKSQYVDIVMVTEGLPSSTGMTTLSLLASIRNAYPEIRVIFIAGKVEDDDFNRKQVLGEIVQLGVYDIHDQNGIGRQTLLSLINNHKSLDDVRMFMDYLNEELKPVEFKNTVVFSSIKPSSGKSTVAVSVAVAIAKYGHKRAGTTKPRVAIIEGDLSTLSVGTLLQMDDARRNLKSALEKVREVVDENGIIFGSQEDVNRVTQEIRQCFIRHSEIDNLYALVSSQFSLDDLVEVNGYHFYFLIQSIVNAFDVIIVDANSSLEHRTTAPLLELSSRCYLLMDLDANNIRNNIRYRRELAALNITGKIRYILNRDLPLEIQKDSTETLAYSAANIESSNFVLDARIPWVDMTVMYNRIRRGTPLILDDTPATLEARKQLMKVANDIWYLDVDKNEFLPDANVSPAKVNKKASIWKRLFGKKRK